MNFFFLFVFSLMKDRQAVTSNALQAHVDSTRDLSFMFFV